MNRWFLAFAFGVVHAPVFAQTYPSKPIRLIVSSAPQGGTDTIARIAAASLTESLGQRDTVQISAELPTVGETLPGVLVSAWYGMQVPAGTPKDIVARLNAAIVKAVATEKVARSIVASGLEPVTNTPEQFAAYIREQTVTWGKVAKAARIPVE